ncbi:inter-alpha-trypsin inhibitor heavy chain H3-like isoform X2 [Pygocentrus nattereri]|uniref:inter-alpha-trypsin inhibitor heavy chain H3-like isoform X2 n=1 Tax=Pygocentrus nattereri TaxID=42514 RepID=UPI001891A340|nr:inter-alpha-trypsin inhibitor heavy chain H3-like isoform X2 [Pygocentrus nattereri]
MDRTTIIATVLGFLLICVTSAPTSERRDIDIYSFHINSTVTSRYAVTVITSHVSNRLRESSEVHFQVKIPRNAFISKFRMTMEGKTYDGVVKEKEEAQRQYSQAVSRGESAGMVSSVGRTLEEFKTSVAVAASSKVTFELTYEELLIRRLGKYQLLINAQPMQPVADFKVDVYINEGPDLSFLQVKGGLYTQELTDALTTTRSGNKAWLDFHPTEEQQTKCKGCAESGLNGDLIITYDVERLNPSGELQTSNGYFVHYFSPTDVQRTPKNVVFIISRGDAMQGRKMKQTRMAMCNMLEDLAIDDNFGLITFDSNVKVWKPKLLKATEKNLEQAKTFVKNIRAQGGTNINAAVLKGVEMINTHQRKGSASILILLTEGKPTSGETNTVRIQANVKEAIGGKFPLYCLVFGSDVNYAFLEKMALENNGLVHRIYEDSHVDIQLQGFYEEVATPLLTDVQLNYTGAGNLTQTGFSHFYDGSEIVVAGQVTDDSQDTFKTEVTAVSKNNDKVKYENSVSVKDLVGVPEHGNFIKQLWAYLTVKKRLDKIVVFQGKEKEAAMREALDLSLKYGFVTPLTSMVVTSPQDKVIRVTHKQPHSSGIPLPFQGFRRPAIAHILDISSVAFAPLPELSSPGPQGPPRHTFEDIIIVRVIPFPPGQSAKFLVTSTGQPKPLCYEISLSTKLRLLMDRSSEFSMNGELSQYGGKGFKEIALHYKTDHLLTLNTSEIRYSDGQNPVKFVWGQQPTKYERDSVSLILENDELNVTMGTVRVVLLLHKEDGDVFLWPAVRHLPKNVTLQGILGKTDVQYEQLTESQIKIKDQPLRAEVLRSNATDYGRTSAPSVDCWLVPLPFVLQGKLSDFTVSQL